MTKGNFTSVSIPEPLFKKIQKKIKNTGFSSVSSYVTFVLREIDIQLEEKKIKGKVSQEKIVDRLEKLGYF